MQEMLTEAWHVTVTGRLRVVHLGLSGWCGICPTLLLFVRGEFPQQRLEQAEHTALQMITDFSVDRGGGLLFLEAATEPCSSPVCLEDLRKCLMQ